MPISCFCAFEGGGAKGIAHLSTLGALERHAVDLGAAPDSEENYHKLQMQGFAGTSAGAIVAALAAAGWRSSDLLDRMLTPPRSPALTAIGRGTATSLMSLLDRRSRRRLRVLKGLAALARRTWRPRVLMLLFAGFVLSLILFPVATAFSALTAVIATGAFVWFVASRYQGAVETATIEALIDELLRFRLGLAEGGPSPTFRTMHERTGVELSIVAVGLDDATLVRFDHLETPDVSVAKAVVASAAIPFVFKPVAIAGKTYCDGGIVSNLPAWAFDTRLTIEPTALVVTSEIEAAASSVPRPIRGLGLAGQVLRAGFFGARALETRGLRNHLSLSLPVSAIGTLDFEGTGDHLDLLDAVDAAVGPAMVRHIEDLEAVRLRHDAYRLGLRGAMGTAVDLGCLVVLKPEQAANGALRGWRPWHSHGRIDGRWYRHLDVVEAATAGDVVCWAPSPDSSDAEWCVVLPTSAWGASAICCIGRGRPERLEEIARSIQAVEERITVSRSEPAT